MSSRYLADGGSSGETKETTTAEFRPWPYGARGLYTTNLTFDRPGSWAIDTDVEGTDSSVLKSQLFFEVTEDGFSTVGGLSGSEEQEQDLR